MKMGLGPGYIVLDGYPALLPEKGGGRSPIYDPFLMWPNG